MMREMFDPTGTMLSGALCIIITIITVIVIMIVIPGLAMGVTAESVRDIVLPSLD